MCYRESIFLGNDPAKLPVGSTIAEHGPPDPTFEERSSHPKVLKEGGLQGHWGLRGIRERAARLAPNWISGARWMAALWFS